MIHFFQKYQRYCLAGVTFLVIVSFFFFGTYSAIGQNDSAPDEVVAKAVDGSKIFRSEVKNLARFLASDGLDLSGSPKAFPNLCNDGVIRYDFLKEGIAELLISKYGNRVEKDLEARFQKIKRFRPYIHPSAPILSLMHVWEQFAPLLKEQLEAIQKEEVFSLRVFPQLVKLYDLASRLPPEWLRQILLYQQQQYSWIQRDPKLQEMDLAMFGFHSLQDWFGPQFLEICSEFVLHTARWAEQKGCRVSLEEARDDLSRNFYTALHKLREANPQAKIEEMEVKDHLARLGFTEIEAAKSWQNVLLMRRFFSHVGHLTEVDRLTLSDFSSFAGESATIEFYEWPIGLRFKTFWELAQFQFYLEAVCPLTDSLLLPKERRPLEEIQENYPFLVQTIYEADICSVNLEEIGWQASLKEVWDWQLQDENWKTLVYRFPDLEDVPSREKRFEKLQAFPQEKRMALDAMARKALVEVHPEWVNAACLQRREQQAIHVSPGYCSLSNVLDPQELADSLQLAVQDGSSFRYGDDGTTLYQITNVKQGREAHVLSFEEAQEQGILALLMQKEWEKKYSDLRVQYPERFKKEDGCSIKSFLEAREEVAQCIYTSLLQTIDKEEPAKAQNWQSGCGPLDSYLTRRFLPQTRKSYEALQNGDPSWNAGLFSMQQKEHHIQRSDQEVWMTSEIFETMVPNRWSPIHVEVGEISFFYFKTGQKNVSETSLLPKLRLGQEVIAQDSKRFLVESFLNTLSLPEGNHP